MPELPYRALRFSYGWFHYWLHSCSPRSPGSLHAIPYAMWRRRGRADCRALHSGTDAAPFAVDDRHLAGCIRRTSCGGDLSCGSR
jgi:hypothetical protein